MTGTGHFTPTGARDLHRNLAEWWLSREAQQVSSLRDEEEANQGVDPDHPWFRFATPDVHRRQLLASETFLVTDEMSAVCRHAAATLPALVVDHATLPAECGFMVFNDRLEDHEEAHIPTQIVAWYPAVIQGKAGVAISTYVLRSAIADLYQRQADAGAEMDRLEAEIERLESSRRVEQRALTAIEEGDLRRARDLHRAAREMKADTPPALPPVIDLDEQLSGFDALRAPAFPALWTFLPYGEEADYWVHADVNLIRAARMTVTAWLLMNEPLTAREKPRIDRPAAKRAQRAGLMSDVTVILLRQPRGEAGGDGSREYHRRWLVRGHWRRIPTPQQPARVTWVHGYVKGPEGAPLVVTDKVTVLAR